MDILWAAMAICAIVSVVFYVLAISWQRTLRSQAGAIRMLGQRLETLETMEDPVMRRKIGDLMPSPLEEVCVLSFRMGSGFWLDTVGLTETQVRHIHEHGTFVGSIKIEIWRSHVTITLRELPPHTQSSSWQTRTVDIYETGSGAGTVLWELDLEPTANVSMRKPAALELSYENRAIVLAIRYIPKENWPGASRGETAGERVVFRIPLDPEHLAEFRTPETAVHAGIEAQEEDASATSFAFQDERQDVDWHLRIHNFNGHMSSGKWAIIEPRCALRVS